MLDLDRAIVKTERREGTPSGRHAARGSPTKRLAWPKPHFGHTPAAAQHSTFLGKCRHYGARGRFWRFPFAPRAGPIRVCQPTRPDVRGQLSRAWPQAATRLLAPLATVLTSRRPGERLSSAGVARIPLREPRSRSKRGRSASNQSCDTRHPHLPAPNGFTHRPPGRVSSPRRELASCMNDPTNFRRNGGIRIRGRRVVTRHAHHNREGPRATRVASSPRACAVC